MKIAICCATPYQTLNAINLVYNILKKDNENEIDLYYRNFSEKTDNILLKIKKYNLFNNIYEYNLVSKEKKTLYYINNLIQAIYPKKFIQDLTVQEINFKKNYECITITSGTEFEVALTRIYPNAYTIAYDDGLGSYIGDIVHDHKLNILWKILGRRTDKIKPKTLYVNNVDFCESILANEIKELRDFNKYDNYLNKMIKDIFDYSDDNIYNNKRIVYLTQPYEEIDRIITKQIGKVESVLIEFSKYGIVRNHPRYEKNVDIGFVEDRSRNLWEIICETSITDNHILISICSTAQILPKLLYGKEPWLIFTYKIFEYSNEDVIKNKFIPIINKIKNLYTQKNKILIPENEHELNNILKNKLFYIFKEEKVHD